MRGWAPWKAWIKRRPAEAAVVLGGFLGLILFALTPVMSGAYDLTNLLIALAGGFLIMGIRIWRLNPGRLEGLAAKPAFHVALIFALLRACRLDMPYSEQQREDQYRA